MRSIKIGVSIINSPLTIPICNRYILPTSVKQPPDPGNLCPLAGSEKQLPGTRIAVKVPDRAQHNSAVLTPRLVRS